MSSNLILIRNRPFVRIEESTKVRVGHFRQFYWLLMRWSGVRTSQYPSLCLQFWFQSRFLVDLPHICLEKRINSKKTIHFNTKLPRIKFKPIHKFDFKFLISGLNLILSILVWTLSFIRLKFLEFYPHQSFKMIFLIIFVIVNHWKMEEHP